MSDLLCYEIPQHNYFLNKNLQFVYGKQDPFLTEKRLAFHNEVIEKNRLTVKIQTFDGEHTVDRTVLKEIFERIKVGSRS